MAEQTLAEIQQAREDAKLIDTLDDIRAQVGPVGGQLIGFVHQIAAIQAGFTGANAATNSAYVLTRVGETATGLKTDAVDPMTPGQKAVLDAFMSSLGYVPS